MPYIFNNVPDTHIQKHIYKPTDADTCIVFKFSPFGRILNSKAIDDFLLTLADMSDILKVAKDP